MRIGVAEDVALLREGIAAILEQHGHAVVWTVEDADRLRAQLGTADDIDLLIADVRMPPHNTDDGLRVAVELRARRPTVGILVLSQHLGNEYARSLLATAPDAPGGTGYQLKERVGRIADFIHSVETVGAGGVSIDPKVIAYLMEERSHQGALGALGDREREVLALMAEGQTNEQIAQNLHFSPATVERRVSAIFTKLDLHAHPGNKRILAVLEYLRN